MLDVAVRFEEKDATIRYLPEKVGLKQILKQYDSTPFEVAPNGPIVTIANTKQFTLRGWTMRTGSGKSASKSDTSAKNDEKLPQPIQLIVELEPAQGVVLATQPQISLSDPPTAELALVSEFQKVESSDKAKTTREAKPKPKKPFVPKALRPASTSNSRRAIEAPVASVSWIKNSVFNDYHTKPEFKGPRKLFLSLQPTGDDVIRLEELLDTLRKAGFPPKSVLVSRRFAGIPFGKSLPGDLQLTGREGNHKLLGSLKKPDRPLVLVFLSLNCPRNKKYTADAKYYQSLKETVDKYQDRFDFHAFRNVLAAVPLDWGTSILLR